MSTTTTTVLGRPESTELSFIDINSSGRSSELWARCFERGREWGIKPLHNRHSLDFLEDVNYSVSRSWCLNQTAFMAARQWVLKFMLAAFLFLGLRDAFEECPLGLHMYCVQVLTAFLAVVASKIFVQDVRKDCRTRSGYLTPVHEFRSKKRWWYRGNNFISACAKTPVFLFPFDRNKLVLRITTLLIQNCCALIVFWDIVFWTGLLRVHNIRLVDFVAGPNVTLLHVCNVIPVLFELLFDATVFRPIFFVPSFLFVSTLVWARFSPVRTGSNGFDVIGFSDLLHMLRGKNSHTIQMITPIRLLVLFISICTTLCWIQRSKHSVATRKFM